MHTLIVGLPKSGKSELAKMLARRLNGADVVVFDPLRTVGWPSNARKFYDAEAFLDYIDTAESKYVFIDEAKKLWDEEKERAEALLYAGRHQGLYIFVIAQRTRMVSPNGRNMCTKIFAFRQQVADAKVLAEEYNGVMIDVVNIDKLKFIVADGFEYQTGRLEFNADGHAKMVLDKQTA